MQFSFLHNNLNVLDLDKSAAFYREALGLLPLRKVEGEGFTLLYLGDNVSSHELELTHIKGRKKPYDLGENEFHLAFAVDNFQKAHALHQKMGCICFENEEMGIYFISDPDGYWLEIVPRDYFKEK